MSVRERPLQYFEDLDAQIFRSGHSFREFLQGIQILKVIAQEHFPLHALIEIDEIAYHSRALINWAADADFEPVIVAVSVRIIAFAIGSQVLFRRHSIAM